MNTDEVEYIVCFRPQATVVLTGRLVLALEVGVMYCSPPATDACPRSSIQQRPVAAHLVNRLRPSRHVLHSALYVSYLLQICHQLCDDGMNTHFSTQFAEEVCTTPPLVEVYVGVNTYQVLL